MANNLLDKSSIILTPTAYDNGKALCVKPSDGSGDFDFSRNSAATRVNAQGLVENVQILSSNLVQNGDFSEEGAEEVSNGSFSQEGVQLVTNGSFDTDSDWIKVNATISGGAGNLDSTSGASLLYQQNILTVGKTYKAILDITNYNGLGTCALINSNGDIQFEITSNGNKEFYFTQGGTSTNLLFRAISGGIFSIDNVSCVEVGQDWTLGTGWSIGEDKIVSVNGSNYGVYQLNALVSGKTYKITYEVKDYVSGQFGIRANQIGGITASANGVYTDYLTSNGEVVYLMGYGTFNGSVTNISFKEVGMDWVLQTGWSIAEDKAISDGTINQSILQTNVFTIGNRYKITFTVSDVVGSLSTRIWMATGGSKIEATANGDYTTEWVADGTNFYITTLSTNTATYSITNISVIQITDDTNLPRINYEGFSYQDALGSELITNGGFDTDSDWVLGSGATISGGKANLDGSLSSSYADALRQVSILTVGKTYKFTYTVSDYVSGGAKFFGNNSVEFSANGTYTEYITATIPNVSLQDRAVPITCSIDNVSVKEYLGQEVVPNSGCGSWLFEPQSTNLITYSEDFRSNSNFTTSAPNSIFESGYLAPDGSLTATRINGFDGYYVTLSSLGSGDARSMYVKSGNGQTGNVNLLDPNSNTHSLFEVTNEWKRVELVGADSWFYIVDGRGGWLTLDDVIVWGLQQEALSYATSYIPTSGSQVTRNQDVCNNGGSLATINSTEGTLYFEASRLSNLGTCQIGLFGSVTSRQLRIEFNNSSIRGQLYNGSYQANMSSTQVVTDNNKIAFKYKENDFALWINGVEVATDNSGVTFNADELIKLNLTAQDNVSFPFFGKTKALAVWKEALSDSELQSLTTI